jgi:protease-4
VKALFRLLLLLILLLALPGCVTINLSGGGHGRLTETVLGGKGSPKIALIPIEGTLSENAESTLLGLGSADSTVAHIRAQLEKAAKDAAVEAVVLRIHSPGGTVTASEMLYREIQRFKAQRHVPVVAQCMGVATSGAYYAAMAADTVLAYPTTVTGSIGVIFAGVNVAGLLDKLGIENQTLTTAPYKDAGSPLRRLTSEERAQLQSVLDDLHSRFQAVVQAGRPNLSPQRVAELADGRIYSATQALANGLIDGITDLSGAIVEARQRAGLEAARVVIYHHRGEGRQNLYTQAPGMGPSWPALVSLLGPLQRPTFLYLWWPGAY